jgi:hypothetical protein
MRKLEKKLGKVGTGTTGAYGLHFISNDSRRRLIDFAASKNMAILNIFPS